VIQLADERGDQLNPDRVFAPIAARRYQRG
jgi:hypothetical protein